MKGLVAYQDPHHHKSRLNGLADVRNAKTNYDAIMQGKDGTLGRTTEILSKLCFQKITKFVEAKKTPISLFLVHLKSATARKAFRGGDSPLSQKGLLEKQN